MQSVIEFLNTSSTLNSAASGHPILNTSCHELEMMRRNLIDGGMSIIDGGMSMMSGDTSTRWSAASILLHGNKSRFTILG
jgi:hypothetical protein